MARYEQVQTRVRATPRTWLVTGAAGFIGSHLLETLLKLDQRVIGLDNFSTGNRNNLEQVKQAVPEGQWKNLRFVEGDIRALDTCRRACRSVNLVLHQAALGSVPRSIADPIATHDSNIGGFLNMLVAAHGAGVARFVYAGSSATYGDHPALPRVESEIGRPLSPYAVSKYVNELYAGTFARCYGFDSIGLRYFNVFGPRQDPNGAYTAVIPKWVAGMIRNEPVHINGDGKTTRDFCYIDNVVQANLLAATSPDAIGHAMNIGCGEQISLNTVLHLAGELLHATVDVEYREPRPGDVRNSLADISLAQRLLGYKPTVGFREGLARTLDALRKDVA